jgi:hypothetical protein
MTMQKIEFRRNFKTRVHMRVGKKGKLAFNFEEELQTNLFSFRHATTSFKIEVLIILSTLPNVFLGLLHKLLHN